MRQALPQNLQYKEPRERQCSGRSSSQSSKWSRDPRAELRPGLSPHSSPEIYFLKLLTTTIERPDLPPISLEPALLLPSEHAPI